MAKGCGSSTAEARPREARRGRKRVMEEREVGGQRSVIRDQ
jgi:hypothetical protein